MQSLAAEKAAVASSRPRSAGSRGCVCSCATCAGSTACRLSLRTLHGSRRCGSCASSSPRRRASMCRAPRPRRRRRPDRSAHLELALADNQLFELPPLLSLARALRALDLAECEREHERRACARACGTRGPFVQFSEQACARARRTYTPPQPHTHTHTTRVDRRTSPSFFSAHTQHTHACTRTHACMHARTHAQARTHEQAHAHARQTKHTYAPTHAHTRERPVPTRPTRINHD